MLRRPSTEAGDPPAVQLAWLNVCGTPPNVPAWIAAMPQSWIAGAPATRGRIGTERAVGNRALRRH